ncbi:hypothetical protein [Nocardioides sp.]|uniref:hypothetical protein n=1 Tax=Nocardioides sp. TaxID=35761 RepID=UPI002C0F0F51|nr:hypothetical protein [Nocardioides sp.]HSX68443.1 hypothetical protein [Nocardioides sp.]
MKAEMMTRMATGDKRGGDRHKGPPQRKVRIEDDLWNEAQQVYGVPERPGPGDRTMTRLIEDLLTLYVDGKIDLDPRA